MSGYIVHTNGGITAVQSSSWYKNFVTAVERRSHTPTNLTDELASYNGCLKIDINNLFYLEFDTETDAVLFMMRWG